MKIKYDQFFDSFEDDAASSVFQIFPNVFNDSRGSFSEVLKQTDFQSDAEIPSWLSKFSWLKQINRSVSCAGTIRGCHAQCGKYCQGKLVEALTVPIYDIIIDARPNSKTFRVSAAFYLNPVKQNKLWVPRGFLHAFAVPKSSSNEKAVFQYFCDNAYSHEDEFGISPLTIFPKLIEVFKENGVYDYALFDAIDTTKAVLSDKDKNGLDWQSWAKSVQDEYAKTGKLWFKDNNN